MPRARALLLVLPLLVGGCGGGSSGGEASTPRTGPIGAIDRATVAAVCADVDVAGQALATGSDTDADPALLKAAEQLEQPPVVDEATALARTLRADVGSGDRQAAVAAGTAWCGTHR